MTQYKFKPEFVRGDLAAPLRRDAIALAAVDVSSEARFGALVERADERGIPVRQESFKAGTIKRYQLLVGSETIAISAPDGAERESNPLNGPAVYTNHWQSDITAGMSSKKRDAEMALCLDTLRALDQQREMQADTPKVKAKRGGTRL